MEETVKILLCEDDENLGMLLREYLQTKGFATTLCPDGEAGFKEFTKNKYDIAVLDVMMPKKDGFTLAQEIRQQTADLPIVFLTAKTLKEDILEGFKIGADDYITKPFSMEELKLTTKENELLALLCAHANEILQRDFALKTIWIDDNYFNARSMDVYITKLRKHLKEDPQIEIINIHGKGYKLIVPDMD